MSRLKNICYNENVFFTAIGFIKINNRMMFVSNEIHMGWYIIHNRYNFMYYQLKFIEVEII